MSQSSGIDAFARQAALPDDQMDLGRAALLLAADEFPGLEVEAYLKRLNMLAAGVAERLPSGAPPAVQISVLSDYLFTQRRFRGNTDNYYDPRNSYLNEVLDRRIGIPITLSVVTIEVARRAGIPLKGVGLPGHFIVRHGAPGVELFFDPFNGGRVLSTEDCHEIVLTALGGQAASYGHFLEPVSTRMILTRMLNNLKVIYLHQGDVDRTIRVLNRTLQLNPSSPDEYRERGLVHMAVQHYRAALSDFTNYLTLAPGAPDRDFIHERIEMIWTALNMG